MRPVLARLWGPLMEFPSLPPAMSRPAGGSGLTARCRSVPPGIRLRGSLPISAGQLDLELIELVPLGVGPLPLRNCLKLLQAGTRGYRLRFVHRGIISLFDKVSKRSPHQHEDDAIPCRAIAIVDQCAGVQAEQRPAGTGQRPGWGNCRRIATRPSRAARYRSKLSRHDKNFPSDAGSARQEVILAARR